MDTKRIKGLQVITLAGVKTGTVDQIFFDPATKHVAGFVLQADPALPPDAPSRFLDVAGVHALGDGALTLSDMTAVRAETTGAPLTSLTEVGDLTKRQVVTEGGTRLGQVAAVEIDPQTLELARIEVSPGFFSSNRWIPADHVAHIGADAIMVADAIAEPVDAVATPPVAEPVELASS